MPPKNDKEVVFFLTNVGVQPKNVDDDYFTKAKEVMKLVVTKKIFMRPKDEVGMMITAPSEEESSMLLQRNQVPTWEMVEKITNLQQTDVPFDDWHSVLADTINRIEEFVQASRTVLIMLFNFDDDCSTPSLTRVQTIIQKTKDLGIDLMWIGSKPLKDCSTDELNSSERILMEILREADGVYRQIDRTLPQLRLFKKPKGRYMAWKCLFQIGSIFIPTATYVQATDKLTKPPFKNVTIKSTPARENLSHEPPDDEPPASAPGAADESNDEPSGSRQQTEELQFVKYERDYVDRHKVAHSLEDTITGYMYGRKFIPVSEADEKGMKYNGDPKSFEVYGFVPRESIKLEDLYGDDSRIVVPDGEENATPFYCLIQAMADSDQVAIVRRIYASGGVPKMGILFPRIDVPGEPWCMILIDLLYAEDRRVIQSRPLNSVMKNLSEEKENIVGDMIDAMMLTDCKDDEDREIFAPGAVPSPTLQHHWNSLAFRALHPDEPVPPLSEHLKKMIAPPESLRIKQEPLIDKLKKLFPIEEELALLKKESETTDQLALPVLSEIKKMEEELEQPRDVDAMEIDVAKGLKRKYSIEETGTPEESDPNLDDLFDGEMSS